MIKTWRRTVILLVTAFVATAATGFTGNEKQLTWGKIPPLPGSYPSSGLFAGVSDGGLICLGGEYPDGTYSDKIAYLKKESAEWEIVEERLPLKLAHGVSVTYNNRVILVGGSIGTTYSSSVYSICYQKGKMVIDTLDSLPYPLANMTGCMVGNTLLIAGGSTHPGSNAGNHLLALDMRRAGSEWRELTPWPGKGKINAVCASADGNFYLFGGKEEGHPWGFLFDSYLFTPIYNDEEMTDGSWQPIPQKAGVGFSGHQQAASLSFGHFIFIGEDTVKGSRGDIKKKLYAYNLMAQEWADLLIAPLPGQSISAPLVEWQNRWILFNGNGSAKGSGGEVYALKRDLRFGWLNWISLVIYLALMIAIGIFFNRRQSSEKFFTAGGSIPWWAAGISIFGTQISAITFMAIPAIVFMTDWSLLVGSVIVFTVIPIITRYYIPAFRRLSVTSAYEYLESRFNGTVRLMGSISFMLFQFGRMGIVLFLPAAAITTITGINIYLLILLIGIICIIYTVLGGIEAVIWADVVQVVVLISGAILCLVVAIHHIDGGAGTIVSEGIRLGKFALYRPGWSPAEPVLWVCIIGFFFLNLIPYSSDQSVVQKYMTVKDERATIKSLWTNAWISIPTSVIFFSIGTALYIFYLENPAILTSAQVGEVLPYFIVRELPPGIAGLVIAGIFAASQSALSSSMNSVSAAYFTDIHQKFFPVTKKLTSLRIARVTTVVVGMIAVLSAISIAVFNIPFIFNLFQEVLGIAGGSLAGVFTLGLFVKRANAFGAIWGMIASTLLVYLIREFTSINVYLYGAVSVVSCVGTGYFFSLLKSGNQVK